MAIGLSFVGIGPSGPYGPDGLEVPRFPHPATLNRFVDIAILDVFLRGLYLETNMTFTENSHDLVTNAR